MKQKTKRIFWCEVTLAVVSALLLLLTLIRKDWIEVVFGIEPDKGSGAFEWFLVIGFATVTVAFTALARAEWRRAAATG